MQSFSRFLWVLALVSASAPGLTAQESPTGGGTPQIVVSAWDEVEVAPDRARIQVTVETRARTPQAASGENARIATDVLAALGRAGARGGQVRTQGLVVAPEYQYPREGGRPTVAGYSARNVLSVEILDLAALSAVLDAAVGTGATNVSGPDFHVSNPDSARREALSAAVRRARADAEVMAEAAGVSLGHVLEITSGGQAEGPVFRMAEMAMSRADASTPTPVMPGLVRIRADVSIRFAVSAAPPR